MFHKVSRTALRLGAAFAIVLALFGVALGFTLRTLDRLDRADSEVATLDHAKHSAHAVAALVREQYIHQAHTIIEWNYSHLDHYEDVAREVTAATRQLRSVVRDERSRSLAEEIARLATRADQDFKKRIVPIVGRGGRETVVPLHAETERRVTRVVALNEDLNTILEKESADAREAQAALRSRARLAVTLCFALALAAAAGVGIAITRSITNRLARVRQGAARLAEGDLSIRIEARGRDEFAELARAFNHMGEALEKHQADRLQAQKLAAIGQVAAGVAHEINNPLGVILGYASLLARDADDEKLRAGLNTIEDETRQCQRIVHGLLELARPPRTPRTPVDLVRIARDAVDHLEEAGKLKGLTVDGPATENEVWVTGDRLNLRQVVTNLVQNAADAASPEGRVAVSVVRRGDTADLIVADSGPGIPEAVLPHLFEPFFTTKAKGTGLGLAISQAIAHAHGGELVVHSGSGKGARATLSLPVTARAGAEAAE